MAELVFIVTCILACRLRVTFTSTWHHSFFFAFVRLCCALPLAVTPNLASEKFALLAAACSDTEVLSCYVFCTIIYFVCLFVFLFLAMALSVYFQSISLTFPLVSFVPLP